jgi:hypothetical protein
MAEIWFAAFLLIAEEILGVVLKANPAKRHQPFGVTSKAHSRQAECD